MFFKLFDSAAIMDPPKILFFFFFFVFLLFSYLFTCTFSSSIWHTPRCPAVGVFFLLERVSQEFNFRCLGNLARIDFVFVFLTIDVFYPLGALSLGLFSTVGFFFS